jgi:hypothetical protein
MNNLEEKLIDEICRLEIIDSHEHLPSEAEYLAFNYYYNATKGPIDT